MTRVNSEFYATSCSNLDCDAEILIRVDESPPEPAVGWGGGVDLDGPPPTECECGTSIDRADVDRFIQRTWEQRNDR